MTAYRWNPLMKALKTWARQLKTEIYALYLAARDPRLPWPVKFLAFCIVGYALSPIDLIPDFIPVLGYLDDLILLPMGIWLLLKLIPPSLMAECRRKAQTAGHRSLPRTRTAAIVIVGIWLGLGIAIAILLSQFL
jgi:uncharacterized membrane protein YkvA (DUF1232 family)